VQRIWVVPVDAPAVDSRIIIADVLCSAYVVRICDERSEYALIGRLLDIEAQGVPPESDVADCTLKDEECVDLEQAKAP